MIQNHDTVHLDGQLCSNEEKFLKKGPVHPNFFFTKSMTWGKKCVWIALSFPTLGIESQFQNLQLLSKALFISLKVYVNLYDNR